MLQPLDYPNLTGTGVIRHTFDVWGGPISDVATIEATEAAALVKNAQQFRPEFQHPKFSTQTLLYSITVPQ